MKPIDETIDGTAQRGNAPSRRFDTTVWSVVMRAGHRSSPAGRQAFAQLCEAYWYPLYAHVRSRGNDVDQAQDLTQGFFETVMEKNYVGDADPNRGKFRTFLLASLNHFLANEYDKRMTLKRGGDRKHVSLDFDLGEQLFTVDPTTSATAEVAFERRWAGSLLDRVLDQLRQESIAAGDGQRFDELKAFLTINPPDKVADVAARLGMTESAVRVAVHRLRSKYRKRLRDEIAATIGDPDSVDEEIAALHDVFAKT